MEDEFDREVSDIVRQGKGRYLARGAAPLERLNRELKLELRSPGVNTLSGLIVSRLGRFPSAGDRVELKGAVAEVVEVEGNRATQVRLTIPEPEKGRSEDS